MRASTITKQLAAGVSDGIAAAQALAAAGYLTLDGSLVSGGVAVLGDSQRRVVIHSAGDDTGLTWTVIGTDDTGNPIKDQFAGVNAGDAQSNLDFLTVTSIYGDDASAGNVYAGTNGVGSSPWKMFADTINTPHSAFDFELLSGSANVSVQYTQEPFLLPIPSPTAPTSAIAFRDPNPNPVAHDFLNLSMMAASQQGEVDFVYHAWRVTINSGTGSVRVTGRQAGLASP